MCVCVRVCASAHACLAVFDGDREKPVRWGGGFVLCTSDADSGLLFTATTPFGSYCYVFIFVDGFSVGPRECVRVPL